MLELMDKERFIGFLDSKLEEGFEYEERPDNELVLFYKGLELGKFLLKYMTEGYVTSWDGVVDWMVIAIQLGSESNPIIVNHTKETKALKENQFILMEKRKRLARIGELESKDYHVVRSIVTLEDEIKQLEYDLEERKGRLKKMEAMDAVVGLKKIQTWKHNTLKGA